MNSQFLNDLVPIVTDALKNSCGGELFIENSELETIKHVDGKVINPSHKITKGFGFRAFSENISKFVHSNKVNIDSIKKAAKVIKSYSSSSISLEINPPTHCLYEKSNPIIEFHIQEKRDLLSKIDSYLRSKDQRIKQVQIAIITKYSEISIITKNGFIAQDYRPLTQLRISLVVQSNKKSAQGTSAKGLRARSSEVLDCWEEVANKALSQALNNLEAAPADAGKMPVVLGNGWAGVIMHEAVGHGLEGDANRKKSSSFHSLMNKKIFPELITVVDNGTVPKTIGSLNIDDEGMPTQRNVLIEKGKLVSYMNDRMNGQLLKTGSTGNARRQSYAHSVMPRMTNTYMEPGTSEPQEIIQSVKNGIYAVSFDGGQVDTVSGDFVFSSSEAYLIKDGKISHPVKGATLIGNGLEVLKSISMVGNDMSLDPGVGTCVKNGQQIPVCVGQPTIKIDEITVGGSMINRKNN